MDLEAFIQAGFQNTELLEQMYWKYRENPNSVDSSWRVMFDQLDSVPTTVPAEATPVAKEPEQIVPMDRTAPAAIRVYHLIQAYRKYGHLMAKINPIATHPIEEPWQLYLENLGFTQEELEVNFPSYGFSDQPSMPLKEIIRSLQEIYCGNIGVEYMGIQDPQLEEWLQQHIEPSRFRIQLTIEQKKMILQHLNKSELFEVFLHTKYVGQKRFSLEGGETLIPILAAIIETGSEHRLEEFIIGMAHRGRLNVLSNILDKSYAQIFSEFEEGYIPISFEGSGDVKYHKGFSSVVRAKNGHEVKLFLTPNPSHLEAVDPVVEGQARAKQILNDDDIRKETVIPILIHGDASLAGQGICYETLQLHGLQGYSTGGTIHLVINNQIGFTTLPKDSRSTYYCCDIARAFHAPVFHVNAEDPESCVFATILAMEMRQKFHCDVFIDINCYRKFGHNEGDEPAFTQPLEYQLIRQKKPIREIYRDDLIHQGVLERQMAEALEEEFKAALQKELTETRFPEKKAPPVSEARKEVVKTESFLFQPIQTGVPKEILQQLAESFCHIPDGLTVHRKLERLISDRLAMSQGKKPIDWGMGETLAYASLLWEGTHIRLSGQDSCRGTFSHRHALWMDQVAERAYYPLKHLKRDQGRFDVYNSPLSEYAVLGFEFGYSLTYPNALVIWEAQFGDFCNGAQIIIDQFISTAEMKWGQKIDITLFLPHGYEGQGPEHSSARIERFLILCGNDNMQVVYPTLPAQLFHLLRRHILKPMNKPLVVFTPKGLLRHPECVNTLDDFTKGSFQEVLDDPEPPKKANKLVFCTGRIYYDLIAEREKRKIKDMAIIRLEQLYPLHQERVKELIQKYKGFKECFWAQEEPENMGAWDFIRPHLRSMLPKKAAPKYIGRKRSASPAAGSFALHKREHAELIEALFGVNTKEGRKL
ncbi:MAG: Multifunctional 2-oxoglutarate metabolism enzyme [Chlamydiae bacterium]|nr:Multifunctional 2-oxoglutarate metabolism enzyme [Chlamydiota bacterium]